MNKINLSEPLFFRPILAERVWGGNRLARLFGKALPPGKVIGESWELSDRPDAQTVVSGGPCDGMTVRQILERDPQGALGSLALSHPKQFPLLIKYIDAGTDLSVQVHPDDAGAQAYNDRGKAECWVVVHADPGAKFIRGLKPGTTRDAYQRAVAEDRVEDVLNSFAAHAGDVLALPPGMVHAIGAGLVVAEIQQNSDVTFRIYDYKRLGLDGKPRQLHIAEALKAIRFDGSGIEFSGDMAANTVVPVPKSATPAVRIERIVESCYFDLQRVTVAPGAKTVLEAQPSAPRVLMAVQGAGTLGGRELKAGQTVLLAAAANAQELAASTSAELSVLVSTPTMAAC